MSLTILEVLENAKYNLKSDMAFQKEIGLRQLSNAITCFENGMKANDDFDEAKLIKFKEDN